MKGYLSKGFTLLELMLVVGLGSMVALNEIDQERLKAEQLRTRAMAAEISQFQSALNSYISYHRGAVTSSSIPPELQGAKTGVNWMKRSSDCAVGTSSFPNEFLPCEYLSYNNSKLGFSNLEFVTFFDTTYNPSTGIGDVVAKTVLSDLSTGSPRPWTRDGDIARGLSGLAAVIVNGDSALSSGATVTSRATFCLSGTGLECSDAAFPSSDYAKDKILLFNQSATGLGEFLRVDGSNEMTGTFVFDENFSRDHRAVKNIARLLGKPGEGVVIGDSGFYPEGLVPGGDLVVADANFNVFGDLIAKRDVFAERLLIVEGYSRINDDVNVEGGLTISGDFTANGVVTNDLQGNVINASTVTSSNGIFTRLTVNIRGTFDRIRSFGESVFSRVTVLNGSVFEGVDVRGGFNMTSADSRILGIDRIVNDKDAVNKEYVDSRVPDLSGLEQSIMNKIYPVGSVYTNYSHMGGSTFNCGNPAATLGIGEWREIDQGRMLVNRGNGFPGGVETIGRRGGTSINASHSHRYTQPLIFGSGVESSRFGSRSSIKNRVVVGTGNNETGERLESINHPISSVGHTTALVDFGFRPPTRTACRWYRTS